MIKGVSADSSHYNYAARKTRHWLPSIIASIDDDSAAQCGNYLTNILCKSAISALETNLSETPGNPDSKYFNYFPGEHYRLLSGLIKETKAEHIIDIGTYTGMSARTMLDSSNDCKVHSFDIVPWNHFESHLVAEDFQQGRLHQHICDLSKFDVFQSYTALIDSADIIFCDAPKDGDFEYRFLLLLSSCKLEEKPRLLVLDDIRFVNMFKAWRSILSPKIDATSFGHWSGTGIVDISRGLRLAE